MSEHTENGVTYEIYEGVETAIGMGANGEAQELAWLAANPGKTIRDGVQAAGRASTWGRRCWKLWAGLTKAERLGFIAEAYKTHPQGT